MFPESEANFRWGQGLYSAYFLGQISEWKGFPGYYIVAFLLKVPIPTQIILILAQLVYFTQKEHRGNFFKSVFSYYPYCLSYFNEFVWNRTQAYKFLADSNIDWGQSKNELWKYVSEHPDAIYSPRKARSERIVVGINDLVGVTVDPDQYAWLRNNFEPVDTIAYTYLIYKISPEDLDELCATTAYCDE